MSRIRGQYGRGAEKALRLPHAHSRGTVFKAGILSRLQCRNIFPKKVVILGQLPISQLALDLGSTKRG